MKSNSRKDARGERAGGLDDATVTHGFLDTERGEHTRDDYEYEGMRHPAAGAYTPPETERIVDCSWDARVDIGPDEALWLERERVWEQPVVVQNCPAHLDISAVLFLSTRIEYVPCISENDGVFGDEVPVVDVVFHQAMRDCWSAEK